MATTTSRAPLLALPEDLLLRVLVGVPRADHGATAAACGAFRAVMSGPRFLRLRREWGFAERGVVLDPQSDTWTEGRPFFRGEFDEVDEVYDYSRQCCQCVHNGRIVLFHSDGVAWERANDGSWSRYEAVAPEAFRDCIGPLAAFGSVLLG